MKTKSMKFMFSMVAAGAMLIGTCLSAFASQAVVTTETVRVRSEASTSGTVVATGKSGEKFEITNTVSGSDGYTWYEISVNGSKGYVRGDLVKVEEDNGTTTTITTDTTANTATSLAPTESSAMTAKTAKIAGNAAVNIRSGAGTGYSKVGSLDAGTEVILVAEATDSSGKQWYQLKCEAQNMEGYIRSDLVTITGDAEVADDASEGDVTDADIEDVEATEEPEAETPEPEVTNNDYEIVYTADDEGTEQYYLYDHVNNTRQKVTDLLSAVDTLNTNYQEAASSLSTFKILTIALGALALIFLVIIVVLLIKGHSSEDDYYYEDDDDDEDEDEDDDDDEEEEEAPRRRTVSRPAARNTVSDAPRVRSSSKPTPRVTDDDEPAPARRPRKAQNFLADDDEFEFEFLNMDDKD